jgi:hypothetical protein
MKKPNSTFCADLSFEVRSDQGAWFWQLVNLCGHLGIVGAATTEAEAVGEARTTIDELSTRCRMDDRSCDSGERATPNVAG